MSFRPECLVVHDDPPAYAVPSETGRRVYLVTWLEDHFECDCPDYFARGWKRDCKHIAAAVDWLLREFPKKKRSRGATYSPSTPTGRVEAAS